MSLGVRVLLRGPADRLGIAAILQPAIWIGDLFAMQNSVESVARRDGVLG